MNRMNIVILLDRLDQMIDTAAEIPLTGRSLIDAEEALDLIDQIKAALPEEVKRAEWLASEKDRMMEESRKEADELVERAETYVAQLVSESEIVQRAQKEAQAMLEEAQAEAESIRNEAADYADRVLQNLEEALARTIDTVRQGRENLAL